MLFEYNHDGKISVGLQVGSGDLNKWLYNVIAIGRESRSYYESNDYFKPLVMILDGEIVGLDVEIKVEVKIQK